MDKPVLLIRKPRIRDVDEIFNIHLKSLSGLDMEDYDWYYNLVRLRSRRRIFRVAIYEGVVVGFIIAYKYRNKAYIDALAVHPDYRGMGIGGALLSSLESELSRRRVEKEYLSVKHDNIPALGFYLRHGYRIDGVVLSLGADTERINAEPVEGYEYRVLYASSQVVKGIKTLPSAWWSSLTEPVDKLLYRRIHSEKALVAYRGGRLRGVMEYEPEQEMIVDYLAVSYHRPREALQALLGYIHEKFNDEGVKHVTIPVDSSKTSLIDELIRHGFRVGEAEYKLVKQLKSSD